MNMLKPPLSFNRFEVDCDVIAVTMATLKVRKKRTSKFQFLPIIYKTKSVTYSFYYIFRKLPKCDNCH